MNNDKALRDHLLELLEGKSAHIGLEPALKDFPADKINEKVGGSPHTAWQLLEHIRIAQWDILDFSRNANYKQMKWPDDYWPKKDGTADQWHDSLRQVLSELQEMRDLVANASVDLFAKIPWGNGQTILREALLIADHNAYHLGQIVLINRMLEK
jgi:DinB superfamily